MGEGSLEQAIRFPERPRCPFCHDAIEGEGEKQGCGSCMAWHHTECWAEAGKCASCGAHAGSTLGAQPTPGTRLTATLRSHLAFLGISLALALLEVLDLSAFGGGPLGPGLLILWLVLAAFWCWKLYQGLRDGEEQLPQPKREATLPKEDA